MRIGRAVETEVFAVDLFTEVLIYVLALGKNAE